MQKQIFVSGIDTDCGKTYITGLLAYHIRKSGINCITSKMVQTGCSSIADDIIEHRRIMEIDLIPEDKTGETCPFVYSFPASPHLSAKIDQRPFDMQEIEASFTKLKKKYELVITEGAGGLAVPLNDELITSDYLRKTKLPLVLVSSSCLGSINHTLLSIDFCINNNINLVTVIYNQFPKNDKQIAESSYLFLKTYLAQNHPTIKLIHGDYLHKDADLNAIDLINQNIFA